MALLLRTDCLETIEKEQVAKLLYVSLPPICGTSDMSCKMTIFYFHMHHYYYHPFYNRQAVKQQARAYLGGQGLVKYPWITLQGIF